MDIGLAIDQYKIGIRCQWIGAKNVHDGRPIYWVSTEKGLAFLIDIELHWIGSEFTPQGCGLGNPIGFGMTLD